MKSKLYKLIRRNRVVAEGTKSFMKRLQKQRNQSWMLPEDRSFIGQSPSKNIGDIWDTRFPAF